MISAIIVSRDSEAHLERCLKSLAGSGAEVLLVDNASRDGSVALVRRHFPEVVVFPQERNLGFAAASNLAAERAKGEALLLLNADAWLEPGALALLSRRLAIRPDVGLVAPTLRYPNGGRQFSWSPARGIVGEAVQKVRNRFEARACVHGSSARVVARLAGRPWFTAACILVRAEAWRSVGGFDESFFLYFEDTDLCIRLESTGWRLVQETRAVVRHAGGAPGRRDRDELYRPSQLHYYRVHRPPWEVRLLERRLRRRFGDEAVNRWLAERKGR
jgi:GT2 family glycosyltransferase